MCVPYISPHLIIFLGMLNLDVTKSTPPLECLHCLFVCNLLFKQISFLYSKTLLNDCSYIEDVHRRRRSRAGFGLVYIGWKKRCLKNSFNSINQIMIYYRSNIGFDIPCCRMPSLFSMKNEESRCRHAYR